MKIRSYFYTSLGDIGVALCWEQIRYKTVKYYDFEPKEKELSMEINTDEYWIPKLPDVVVKSWDYLTELIKNIIDGTMLKNIIGRYNMTKKQKNKVNKTAAFKKTFKYILLTSIITVISAPFTLLYGPFENAKKIYVGSAMSSMTHQWLATTFLSQDRIDEVLNVDVKDSDEDNSMNKDDADNIEIPKSKDSSIELKEINDENHKFKGYALIVNDPTRVKVGVSSKIFKEGEAVSTIAENYDAVAAINGGYFTDEAGTEKWTSNGGTPTGFLMADGVVINEMNPEERGPILALTKEGRLLIGETTVSELLSPKEDDKDIITEAISYVTTLVKNGRAVSIAKGEGTAPKTMIGQRSNGQMVLVVLDSNLPGDRICATLKEAQKVMIDLGCYNAVNLDGGKSTTMYYDGEVINNPSYALGERPISSGFIIK